MDKITQIEEKFKIIKNVGGDGEALAKLTHKTIDNMKIVVKIFEEGQSSTTWMNNFSQTLTAQEQQDIFAVYQIFKQAIDSLDSVLGE